MQSITPITPSSASLSEHALPPRPPRSVAHFASWAPLGVLTWLDDLDLPHWAPEGDPSIAVRAYEPAPPTP